MSIGELVAGPSRWTAQVAYSGTSLAGFPVAVLGFPSSLPVVLLLAAQPLTAVARAARMFVACRTVELQVSRKHPEVMHRAVAWNLYCPCYHTFVGHARVSAVFERARHIQLHLRASWVMRA